MLDTGLKTLVDMFEEPCVPLANLQPTPGLKNFLKTAPNCDLGATRSCLHNLCNCTLYSLSFPNGKLQFTFLVVGRIRLPPSQTPWLWQARYTHRPPFRYT